MIDESGDYDELDLKKEAASRAFAADWIEKLQTAQKRQENWEKDAEDAEAAYVGDVKSSGGRTYAFNILHSNVETIVPAIYNSTPAPDIRPRFGKDGIAKEFGLAMERVVSVMIDDNKMDKEIEAGARDAYLSGRDIVRVRFEADMEEVQEEVVDPVTGYIELAAASMPTNERITFEAVSWRDFRMGPARRWEDVQWVAFAHRLPIEEVEEWEDGDRIATERAPSPLESVDDKADVTVWEIWCKREREVYWLREDTQEIIREDDDPLGLPGFFPCPEPIQPITLTGKMTPVCPFTIYKSLADELDQITRRIRRITGGLKLRGIIAGDATDVAQLAALDDWDLMPAQGTIEQLAQIGKMDQSVNWWPVDQAIKVLAQLYQAREMVKATIYEVTGISDIVRGASQASETATAQQIKTQWGSIRIQRMQKLIQRQVRDIFVMMVDIISRNFRPQRISELTGLQLTPEILEMMQRPVLAHYRVDVESDSTIRADLTRAKGEMAEFLQGTAQYFGTMAPLVQQSPDMAAPAADIFASFARVFRLGKQAEDSIEQLSEIAKQAAQQPRPDPAGEAMKAEVQMKQAELQLRQQEAQGKAQAEMARLSLERQKAQADVQIKGVELQIKRADLALKERQMELEGVKALADMELEEAQQRPVKIGND